MGSGTPSSGRSLFDMLRDDLEPRIRADIESRFDGHIEGLIADGRQRLDAAIADTSNRVEDAVTRIVVTAPVAPAEPAGTPPSVKADARNRSWRTLLQGGAATVVVAIGGGVADAIARPGFDLFTVTSLQTAASAGATAALAALFAYGQRLIQPPKF